MSTQKKQPMTHHLWDQEPSLWTLVRTVTTSQPLPAGNPRQGGTGPTLSQPAVDLGNPRMKISLWGPAEQPTLTLAKTDVWDRRREQWEKPLTLDEIRAGCFSPYNDVHRDLHVFYRGIENWGYMLPEGGWGERYASWQNQPYPCPKPVGQVILCCPDFAGAAQPSATFHYDNGTCGIPLRQGASQLNLTYLTMMARNLIAIHLQARDLARPIALRLYRHTDTTNTGIESPTSGAEGRLLWLRQRLPAEKTFPNGFEVVLMALVPDEAATVEITNGQRGLGTPMFLPAEDRESKFAWLLPNYDAINEAPGSAATATLDIDSAQERTLLVAVATSAESDNPWEEARRQLLWGEEQGWGGLLAENTAWYQAFYERREHGRIVAGDVAWSRQQIPLLSKKWNTPSPWEYNITRDSLDRGQLTNPNPTRFEADETYANCEVDTSHWHGLPCLNEVYHTAVAVVNQADRLSYYRGLVSHWLEASRKNAREVFGLPGMFGPAHGYLPPIKADEYSHSSSSMEFCMEIPAQVLKVLWDVWDYGGDEEFLRQEVYPALRELAIFYSAYVTLGDDGYYHAIPTVSAEHWGWTYRWEYNRDCTAALSLIKWTLRSAEEAAKILGQDGDLLPQWRQIAERIAPYPMGHTPEGPIYGDVADHDPLDIPLRGYNFYPGIFPTAVADEINLDSDPQEIATMVRTGLYVGGWVNQMVFHLLGAFPETVKSSPDSEYFPAVPDAPIATREQLLDAVASQPERLLNSRSGRIHLFPCVPQNTTVAFRDFQARGGFLVSAEMIEGQVGAVRIVSRRDVPCRMKNPWPGRWPMVKRETDGALIAVGADPDYADGVVFSARAGEAYFVGPT